MRPAELSAPLDNLPIEAIERRSAIDTGRDEYHSSTGIVELSDVG